MVGDLGVRIFTGDEADEQFDADEAAQIMRRQNELAFAALRLWLDWFRRKAEGGPDQPG